MQSQFMKALQFAEVRGYFETLEKIYGEVPSCSGCVRCKSCCSESVDLTYVEFLYILKRYFPTFDHITDLSESLQKRLLKYYFLSYTKPQKCPFLLENGDCEIYEARPLTCRVFGTLNKSDYEANFVQITKQNIKIKNNLLKNVGSAPSNAMIYRKIPFCEYVKVNQYTSVEMKNEWMDKLIFMDSQIFFSDLMTDSQRHGNLVSYFMAINDGGTPSVLNEQALLEIALGIMKDYNSHRSQKQLK